MTDAARRAQLQTPERSLSAEAPQRDARRRPTRPWLTTRAIALGLLFAPLCSYWAGDQGVDVIFSLMVPPVVLTLILVAVNVPLRRYVPRIALTEGELILFYGM